VVSTSRNLTVGAVVALAGTTVLALSAVPRTPAPAPRTIDAGASRQTAYVTGDPALDALQDFFAPTLAANRKEFRGQLGPVEAFGAGDRYPQIWLRDSATLIPLSRYLYGRPALASWIEEHLAAQAESGALFDWIAAGEASHFTEWAPKARDIFRSGAVVISADTNTTEADQETSAVEAAYQVWQATGDDAWLRKLIRGRSILDRLSAALRYVLTTRFDSKQSLVVNALTADWGDVSPAYPDQRAIYVDDRTPLAVGLYTNALAYRAALRLAAMHEAAGDPLQRAYFRSQTTVLRAAADRRLWQEQAGFYRMHVVTTPERAAGFPDDAAIFALGGNALAVLSGLANDAQARRIFNTAAARQREHHVSTIASVLLPPYPAGAFKHPMMAQPWQYQNGGQWDWFAGRFLRAEFERGHSQRARAQLQAIAARVARSRGVYEWNTREGEGKGSPRYAASAGALADAVFHGLFGVTLARGQLDLDVRLDRSGAIHLYQPATDTFVAYRFEVAPARLVLRYESNAKGSGRAAVLLPKGKKAGTTSLDGRPVTASIETVGDDRFAFVETDWKPHRLEIALAPMRQGSRVRPSTPPAPAASPESSSER
jgi:hypothetical protein